MPLASRDVDFQNVSPTFVSRNLNGPMAPVACSLLKVRSVLEVVQTERTSEGRSVLHSVRLSRVTRAAERELFCRLMNVTGITLRVLWHAGLQALLVEAMTETTFGRAVGHLLGVHLAFHLLGVRMIAMGEAF